MIEIIVSDNCPHCKKQEEEMERYFFDDEYILIKADSKDFLNHPLYEKINSVPFVVIRNGNDIIYSKVGFHDEEKLRQIIDSKNNKNNGKI